MYCREPRRPFVLGIPGDHRMPVSGSVMPYRSLPMPPTITAFESSPARGGGPARDMQVRRALEEVGRSYDVRLVPFSEMKAPAHRALHPFGQIPTYQVDGLALFESGAIVLHLAQHHSG